MGEKTEFLDDFIELNIPKNVEDVLFKKALKSRKLTVKDLIYQAELIPKISFQDALIGAYIVKYCLNPKNMKKVKYVKTIQNSKKSNVKKEPKKSRRTSKRTIK